MIRTLMLSAILCLGATFSTLAAAEVPDLQLAHFQVDITPPIGHPLLAGWRSPAKTIETSLFAKGVILVGDKVGQPIAIVALDWCELRNDAYDQLRDAIAAAVGTTSKRVLLSCIHQHDTPYADVTAQRLLAEHGLPGAMFSPQFFDKTVRRIADSAKTSLKETQPVTHIGSTRVRVEEIACNRRVEIDGQVSFRRYSFTTDKIVRLADEGEIDPHLASISFWNERQIVAVLHSYATHPMSYYGRGDVSYDFVGIARERLQREDESVFQVYMTGCSGDVTAARYNDGNEAGRKLLAARLYKAMKEAVKSSRRQPVTSIEFRCEPLVLQPRESAGLDRQTLERTLADEKASNRARIEAALGLSWQARCRRGQPIDVPLVDFGAASLLLLPAESFVSYQLQAQAMVPGKLLMTVGFSECAPGYIPTDKTEEEGFVKEHGYSWAAEKSEQRIVATLEKLLKGTRQLKK